MTAMIGHFLRSLCGEYSNQQQAFENPPLFAHIFLRYTPIEHLLPGTILLEQTYAVDPKHPYRLRVIRAEEVTSGIIKLWNHTFKKPEQFSSATFDIECRKTITEEDLIQLDHCHYQVRLSKNGFHGELEPGCRCIVHRNGKETYLVSSFHLQGNELKTLDRGYDPQTHKRSWGSIAGAFHFQRISNWADNIPSTWLSDEGSLN